MPPDIPDRWLDYRPVGEIIKGTRFIAFKVPLRSHVVQTVPAHISLDCVSLLDKIPNLGMIIDLTNTYRYYDPAIFQEKGLVYEKLKIPGHEIPERTYTNRFNMLANNFLQANANNAKLIGVHCTHGVNRTGYLISNFMISEMKMSPQEAIKCVEEARGHAIDRENYRQHLMDGCPSQSHPDNYRHSSNNISNHNTWHRSDNNRSQRFSNNRPTDNWRVPQSDSPAQGSFQGNRYNNNASGRRQGNYNDRDRDERQYSQQRSSYDRNERQRFTGGDDDV